MRFPLRDFTEQYISSSYQDVLQQYFLSDVFYLLDGYGNVIFSIPSSSVGQMLITSNMTSSMSVVSSSYSLMSTNSEASDFSLLSGDSITSTSSSYSSTTSDYRPDITTITESIYLNNQYNNVLVSCSVSQIYISLPSASLNNKKVFNIKKIDNTNNFVVIQTVDSSSIDDTTYKVITTQYTNLTIQSNGVQYYIL